MSISTQNEEKQILKAQAILFSKICTLDEESIPSDQLIRTIAGIVEEEWVQNETVHLTIILNGKSYSLSEATPNGHVLKHSGHLKNDTSLSMILTRPAVEPDFKEEEKDVANTLFTLLVQKLNHRVFAEEIEEEKALVDKAYNLAHIGTWEYDMINDTLHWSDITKEVHGFGPEYEPDVQSTIQLFKEGYHRDRFEQAATQAIEHEKPFDVELKIISGQGDERWIRATGEPEYKNGVCTRFYGISQNVTERRKAKEDLEYNERRFKALVQNGMDMIAILDEEANYSYVSPAAYNVLSLKPDYFIGRNAFEFIHPKDISRVYKQFDNLEEGKSVQLTPFRFLDADDNWRWIEATVTNLMNDPAVKGYVSNSRDVTARQIKQDKILDSLKEKETLLAEIHHRIKNNLTGLISMLQLQAYKENNDEVLERLIDSIARINTMASIHEQLYQSNDYAEIELSERTKLLALNIAKTFKLETDITHDFQLESVKLSVDEALPYSLIANEVLTNIHKHAFTGHKKGKISIALTHDATSGIVQLTIKDNGVGLPEGYKSGKDDSMGMTVIKMMAEKLDAEYTHKNKKKGTVFTLAFIPQG